MAIRVLGPFEAADAALRPRERAFLAALIVRGGEYVPSDELADAYWGADPPRTWSQQVKTSIARIRIALGPDAVRTRGSQYALGLDPLAVDAVEFERLVAHARTQALQGDHDRAIDAYGRALALWRGRPFPELVEWIPAMQEADRLVEVRRSVEEELLEERLQVGARREIIADAERAVRLEPLREDRWAILATANYRVGRQAEALATIRAARTRLAEEIGVEPSARLRDLETAILRQDPALDAVAATPDPAATCPYRGLAPFGLDDADEFFGRQDQIDAILSRVRPGTLLAVIGASGSGKSSLVLAGVIPRVRDAKRSVAVVPAGSAAVDTLRTQAQHRRNAAITVIDQAEALFLLSPTLVEEACRLLAAELARGATVVLTLRSDFVDRAIALPEVGDEIARGLYALGPLSEEGLRAAVTEPAARAGLRLEPGLLELIVRDAGDRRTTLPHVSHALLETWVRREGSVLTVDGYENSGGIAGAIAQSAEQAYQSMDAADAGVCRNLMLRLIQRDADGRSVRRPAQLSPLLTEPRRRLVLERLIAARLLTSDGDTVMVAHEAIATAWPRLDGWLEEDVEEARLVAAIALTADLWQASGRPDEELLRGARLHAAIAWREASSPDLTEVERALLDASAARERDEVRELEERAARDKRSNTRLRWTISGAGVLLVAALVGGGMAVVRSGEAQAAAQNARIEALTATSLALLGNDRGTAALLAAESYRRWPDDPRTRSALWGVVVSTGGISAVHHESDAHLPVLDMIPQTTTAVRVQSAAPGQAPKIDIVDIDTGEVRRTFDIPLPVLPPNVWNELAVSPDGSVAAIQSPVMDQGNVDGCCARMLTVIDLVAGTTLPPTGLIRATMAPHMVFDESAQHLVVAQPFTGDVMIVDVTTGEARESTPGAFDVPSNSADPHPGAAFIDDGSIAVGAGDRVRVFDRDTLARTRTVPLDGHVATWDIIADGEGGVVTTGGDGTVRTDLASGATVWRRETDGEAQCANLHLIDSGTLACGSYLGLTRLDLATGVPETATTTLQLNRTPYLATIDDDSLLVSVEQPAVWMRWRIDQGGAGAEIIAEGRELIDGPEQGGSLVVTRPIGGGPMRLWDVDRDIPVGEESERIVLLGSGVAARFDQETGVTLEHIATSEQIPLRIPGLPEEFDVMPGGWERPAFAVWDSGMIAFDPATGEALGATLAVPSEDLFVWSVSETRDATRALVSFDGAGRLETALFDLASGAMLLGGLTDIESSQVVSDEQFVGVSESEAHLYDLATLEPTAALPRAIGGGQWTSVSLDGKTLLNVGWNNAITLYDLTTDIALASPLRSDMNSFEFRGGDVAGFRIGGFLTADGETLLERVSEGIRVWDLRPSEQARDACALAGRELTEEQWETYFPGEDQVATCAELEF